MAASVMRPVPGLITTELLTGLLLKGLGVEGEPGDPPAKVEPADDVHTRAAKRNKLEPVQSHMTIWKPDDEGVGEREIEGVLGSSGDGATTPPLVPLGKYDSVDIFIQTLENLLPQRLEAGDVQKAAADRTPGAPSPMKGGVYSADAPFDGRH